MTKNWAGYAATLWCLMYAALGVAWALGAPGFPWGASDPDPDGQLSLLAWATPQPGGWWIAGLALAGAAVALTMATVRAAGNWLVGFACVAGVVLVLVIPDQRVMMGVAYSPVLALAPLTGWPEGVSLLDLWPWEVLNQLLCMLGGALLLAAALVYRRGARGACQRCGRPGWTAAARWGRWAVYVAAALPLIYSMTRWAWALGIPLGVSAEFLAEGERDGAGIWLAGAYLASFGAIGGVLTLGLIQRWGEVFPRWIPGLRGKRVPPRLAIIPGIFVAIIVTVAGLTYWRLTLAGRFEMSEWGAWLPELFWPVWGAALAAGTFAYHLRRRGACRNCGQG